MSNSLLSFAKLEFVDMDTLEVRPLSLLKTSMPSDLCPSWCWKLAAVIVALIGN